MYVVKCSLNWISVGLTISSDCVPRKINFLLRFLLMKFHKVNFKRGRSAQLKFGSRVQVNGAVIELMRWYLINPLLTEDICKVGYV